MAEVQETNGYLDVENATLRSSKIEATSNIGIANTAPQHAFSVGSNLFIDTESSNVLTVKGNVLTEGVKMGFIEITPSYDFAAVSNVGNVTQSTIQFSNATTGFVTTANIEVGTANLFVDTTTGRVGIGTDDPQDVTHIYKSGANGDHGLLIEQNNSGTGSATLKFGVAHTAESTAGLSKAGIFFKRGDANGRGDLLFCVDNADDTNDVDTSNHALTIYRDGNVGIGTTNPKTALDINGDVAALSQQPPSTLTFNTATSSIAGHGDYVIDTSRNQFNTSSGNSTSAFDPTTGSYWSSASDYTSGDANTSGTFSSLTDSDSTVHYGAWAALELPYTTKLRYVIATQRLHSSGPSSFPSVVKVFGASAIGGTLYLINTYSVPTASSYSGVEIPVNASSRYKAYYFSFPSLQGGSATALQISRINLFTETIGIESSRFKATTGDFTGNVGIGTTNPETVLHVLSSDSSTSNQTLKLENPHAFGFNTGLNIGSSIVFKNRWQGDGINDPIDTVTIEGRKENNANYGDSYISFKTRYETDRANGGAGTLTEKMRITGNGNVGIGTDNPDTSLYIKPQSAGDIIRFHGGSTGSRYVTLENRHGTIFDTNSDYPNTLYNFKGNSSFIEYGFSNSRGDFMRINYNGNVGIGTTNPDTLLHLEDVSEPTLRFVDGRSSIGSGNTLGKIQFYSRDGSFSIGPAYAPVVELEVRTINTTVAPDGALYFRMGTNGTLSDNGYITYASANNQINFTGQHRTFIKDIPFTRTEELEGLIVSADNNKYIKMSGGIEAGSNAITTNESLPVVSLSTKVNDKKCFGVISTSEDPDTREDAFGNFVSIAQKELGDTRVYINSVGEGAIWVTDINGPLESGDYITTSNVAGYGQKQDSEFLANYTVAKITMDCDFDPVTQPVQIIKKELQDVNYWVKTTYENISDEEYSNLTEESRRTITETVYTNEDGEIFPEQNEQSTYTELEQTTYQKITVEESKTEQEGYELEVRQELVNVLDEHGQIQWEDDPSGATEKAYKIRYLDSNGVETDEASHVHKAAFVGCTYHCG